MTKTPIHFGVMVSDSYLIRGNPLEPDQFDIIAQVGTLNVGEPLPEGWIVTTGNNRVSEVWRIAYRGTINEESDA